jgi:hypothetical protein
MGIFPENSVPNDTKRTARDVDARTISGAGVRYSKCLKVRVPVFVIRIVWIA